MGVTHTPDGTGLPVGNGTASTGEIVFTNKCTGCHGGRGEGRDPVGPQLVGGIGSLRTRDPVLTVGSYWPYSTSVWDYIHRAMPYYPKPGTLSVDETYALTAYILYLNRIIARDEVMNQQTLPKVRMPNRDGFVWIQGRMFMLQQNVNAGIRFHFLGSEKARFESSRLFMERASHDAARTLEDLPDIINVALEQLIRQRFEPPADSARKG